MFRALSTRAIETAGERIVKRLDPAAAAASRDALAKALYARLFDWLVSAVNRKISALGAGHASSGSRCGAAEPALCDDSAAMHAALCQKMQQVGFKWSWMDGDGRYRREPCQKAVGACCESGN